jgi:hypothetical protein
MIARVYVPGDLDPTQPKWISGAQYACQKIKQRLSLLKGEWMWDRSVGISYFRDVLVKGPNTALIRGIYVKEILAVPGIISVDDLKLDLNPASRLLSVEFSATYRDENGATAVKGQVL